MEIWKQQMFVKSRTDRGCHPREGKEGRKETPLFRLADSFLPSSSSLSAMAKRRRRRRRRRRRMARSIQEEPF